MYTFKGTGMFHFDVSEVVRGGNVLGLPDPKLLMLAPGVQLFAESEDAFLQAVTTLAQFATMTGRKLVLPNPPCDSMWINILPNIKHPWMPLWPDIYDGIQVLQFLDTMRGSNFTYCHWMRAFDPDCRAATSMHADAVAFPQPEMVIANAAAFSEAAGAFEDKPVLFLGAVPKVGSLHGMPLPSEEDRKCYLFTVKPPHFEPLESTEEARKKWLSGSVRKRL